MALTEITKVTGPGIHTLSNILSHNINSSGIITATKFVGPIEGSITSTDASFTGNVSIGGTLTYEDVTNIDSVGVVTARDGIFIPDNKKLILGSVSGRQLEIFHNTSGSSNHRIQSTSSTNHLNIIAPTIAPSADLFAFRNLAGNQNVFRVDADNSTKLYFNGNEKLTTENTGVNITGIVTATSADINGDLDVDGHTNLDNVSVAGVSTHSEHIHLLDDKRLRLGSADNGDAVLLHNGTDTILDNQTGNLFLRSATHKLQALNADNMIVGNTGGSVDLHYSGSKKFETTHMGGILSGILTTTSLEGAGGNLPITVGGFELFRFTSTGRFGIGTNNPTGMLHIYGVNPPFRIQNSNDTANLQMGMWDGSHIMFQASNRTLKFATETTNHMVFNTGGLAGSYERLRITSGGTVNIGGNYSHTSSKLQVTGTSTFQDINVDGHTNLDNTNIVGILTVTSTTQYGGYKLSNNSSVVGELVGLSGSNDTGALALWSGGSKYVQLSAQGNSYILGGNVGIGEDDPDGNQLLIRGASTFQTAKGHIMLTGDSATVGQGPQIVFSESGSGSSNAGAYIGHVRQGSNSIGDLVFGTRGVSGDASTVPDERLRIKSDGNVTISNTTTSPTGDFRMLTMIARSDKQASIGFAQASGVYSGATATGGYTVRLATDAALELATHNSNIIALKATQTGNVEMVGDLKTHNLSGRNIVINGDMRVAQRATSASMSNHGNDIPVCDRWNYNRNGVTATVARVEDAPAGYGFRYSLKWTSTSAVGSLHPGNALFFTYNIEGQDIRRLGYGSSGAKKATLSFWAKGSLAGKIGMSCTRDSRIFSANVDMTANTWQYHTITIPADTSTGFSGNDNASGFLFRFCWGAGSNSTSGTTGSNWINFHNAYTGGMTAGQQGAYLTTNGSTFQITGVQLEIGSQATPFEHRPISEELARCQRYFAIFPGRSGGIPFWQGYMGSSDGYCSIPVPNFNMRVVPTPTDATTGTSSSTGNIYNATGNNINSRFAGNGTVTLSCGGYAPSGIGLIMNFGTHQSGAKEGVVASWNGASPGIFLDAEL